MRFKKLISLLLAAVLCFCISALSVHAAIQLGSITIRVETLEENEPVPGYKLRISSVADPEGWLDVDFAPAGITPSKMLDEQSNPENAAKLVAYAKANGISGYLAVCDSNGEVYFDGLDAGIYMVWPDEDNELTFSPYLIFVPTVIKYIDFWDILSVPKVGRKLPPGPGPGPGGVIPLPTPTPDPGDDPSIPTVGPGGSDPFYPEPGPGGEGPAPDTPEIPQTGINRMPAHLLLLAGLAFTTLGIVTVIRGKGWKEDE